MFKPVFVATQIATMAAMASLILISMNLGSAILSAALCQIKDVRLTSWLVNLPPNVPPPRNKALLRAY